MALHSHGLYIKVSQLSGTRSRKPVEIVLRLDLKLDLTLVRFKNRPGGVGQMPEMGTRTRHTDCVCRFNVHTEHTAHGPHIPVQYGYCTTSVQFTHMTRNPVLSTPFLIRKRFGAIPLMRSCWTSSELKE